jgi:hypothetical protein
MQLLCIQQNIFAQDTIVVSKPVKQNMLTNDTISVTKPLGQNVSSKDTSAVDRHVKQIFKPEPLRATMLAVAFPGLGQIYNRKYWKIPVVYVGFGALVYSAGFNGKNYNLYMKAYQDFTDNILATNSYLKVISPSADRKLYDPLFNPTGYDLNTYASYKEAMLRMVDYYKRYRDLSYIGIAGWYLISILDANVDASLYNYEVNNNLNITLAPIPMSLPGGFIGAGLSVDLKVNF